MAESEIEVERMTGRFRRVVHFDLNIGREITQVFLLLMEPARTLNPAITIFSEANTYSIRAVQPSYNNH
jgi:hypothetical protein